MITVHISIDQLDELHRRMAILEALTQHVGEIVEDSVTGIALQTALWDVEKCLEPIKHGQPQFKKTA